MFSNLYLKAMFVCFLAVALYALLHCTRSSPPVSYKKKKLMTAPDQDFFRMLKEALPECHIFPRLALADLIQPIGSWRNRQAGKARIEKAHIGYAIFDDRMELISVVELDKRSHHRSRQRARDKHLTAVGIPVVRFRSDSMPSVLGIRNKVFGKRPQRVRYSSPIGQEIPYTKPSSPDADSL